MSNSELVFEQRGYVRIITLNRPQALNALTQSMLDAFDQEWARLNEDESTRVVIITGAGRGFCSGIDLKQNDLSSQKRRRPSVDYSRQWIARLQALNKPAIAAVNGVAAGGGLGLALGCDIRLASEEARFSAIFANIGMTVLDGVGHTLVQAVGLAKALELVYTADIISAKEAERIGMVSYVYPAGQLMEKAMELAERIAAGPPMALALSKHVLHGSIGKSYVDHLPYQNLAIQLNAAFASHDIAEGGRAFRERRKPQFRGPLPSEGAIGGL